MITTQPVSTTKVYPQNNAENKTTKIPVQTNELPQQEKGGRTIKYLNDLATDIDKLVLLVGKFEEKLKPILLPESPKKDEPNGEIVPPLSDFAVQLRGQDQDLKILISQLTDLYKRIDL